MKHNAYSTVLLTALAALFVYHFLFYDSYGERAARHAFAQREDTVYQTIFTDVTATTQSSPVRNIGQSQHDTIVVFEDQPALTCAAGAITAFYQVAPTNTGPWVKIGVAQAQSITDGTNITARVRAEGAQPFVRLNLAAFDTTNCQATAYYAGTLFPYAFQAIIPEVTLSGLAQLNIDVSGAGNNALVTGISGLQVCVYELLFNNSDTTTTEVALRTGTTTVIDGPFPNFGPNSSYLLLNAGQVHYCTNVGDTLNLNSTVATRLTGHLTYRIE